jgi:predicted transcriptional regulator
MTKQNRQRSIRFKGDLEEQLAALAEAEDRTFSATVNRLLRRALAQPSYAPQPTHHHEASAA